jgi:hypothetical protein
MDSSAGPDVIAFVDSLLIQAAGTTVRPGTAADLAVSDIDRLCAAIYLKCFGELIESEVSCRYCPQSFEMRFSLSELMEDLADRKRRITGPDEKGVFTSNDGYRFRLPTAGEQRQVSRLATETAVAILLDRCVLDKGNNTAGIDEAMQQAGPVLDLDLNATCPHCGTPQAVRFDIQSHLFAALGYEKQFLLYEVHRIAMAYRWTYRETLNLTRNDRRILVRMIEAERVTRRRTAPWMDI